jgi:Phage integrase, N-terminal SAM-like domain
MTNALTVRAGVLRHTTSHMVPALIADAGEPAAWRYIEFFTANIHNPNTRRAYARATVEFFDWLHARGVTRLADIESVHVAAYIEQLQKARSAPTAKLRLAALRIDPRPHGRGPRPRRGERRPAGPQAEAHPSSAARGDQAHQGR